MRSMIAYYSYTGHSKMVAEYMARELGARGDVTLERLKPVNEVKTFFGQCRAAFARSRAELEPGVTFDLSHYDLIVLGCPVWAFAPVPAVNTYLDKLSGIQGKRAIVFLTSGSGAGVGRCFNTIRNTLESKGVVHVSQFNIPDRNSNDEPFIANAIARAIAEAVI
ncbi:MAG: hypothetical protein KBB52_00985 [Candidatus Omnitrophica bacterium]|nr:hypothetical protein [Candidatus Omnitrophota bacterium]